MSETETRIREEMTKKTVSECFKGLADEFRKAERSVTGGKSFLALDEETVEYLVKVLEYAGEHIKE